MVATMLSYLIVVTALLFVLRASWRKIKNTVSHDNACGHCGDACAKGDSKSDISR